MVQTFNLQTVKYDLTTGALLVYYLDQHGRTYLIDTNERELPAPFYTMSPAAIIAWANRPGIAERVLFLSPEAYYDEAY